jgi:hypothetical protein
MGQPTVAQVASGATLPATLCNCTDKTTCAPIATGLLSLSAPKLDGVINLQVRG